ncbi:hypothetical protein M378DRAFT_18844 [Amanita muscaria Koide BX008]|uniref:CCHC-type domain-containing protein n=1 Tax=Amanita muscaria (strain Koide BX008) TaxID=946122 RepID=A0A0C2RW70_AMAMK|nr:hypothetical protein M378DRAFT_18844 [Amanita muscaria Koide BX008]
MKKGIDRRGAIDGNSRDPDAMDTSIDWTQINAVKAQPTDKCYYCKKTGHWAKDCYQKKRDQGQGQGTSANGVSFQRGNYNRGRGRGRGNGNSRGRGNTRGSQRGRGRGKSIRAMTGEEQEEKFEEENNVSLVIAAVLSGMDDEERDQIVKQLIEDFQ